MPFSPCIVTLHFQCSKVHTVAPYVYASLSVFELHNQVIFEPPPYLSRPMLPVLTVSL